jgi:plasmid replication initiation protein
MGELTEENEHEQQLEPQPFEQQVKKDQRSLTMSNALVRALHKMTLTEKRVVALAATKLFKGRPPRPGESPVVKITAAEFSETYGVLPDVAYRQLKAAGKSLLRRYATFFTPAYRRGGKRIQDTEHNVNWLGRASYQAGEGWIELAFWHEIAPHLMGLRGSFTRYRLEQASGLRSMHSWKLLELLMRFRATGWAEYTIEDFCLSMGATEKQREDFGKIRTKIIEPAVEDLVKKDGWIIKWHPIKAGRKVKGLRFEFSRNPQGELPL